MGDYEKFMVAAAIGLGWICGSALLGVDEGERWRKRAADNIGSVLLFSAAALLLLLLVSGAMRAEALSDYLSTDGPVGETGGPLVRVVLGLLAGLSLARFNIAAREAHAATAGITLIPFLIFFGTSFFADELRQGYVSLTRVSAGGVAVDFEYSPRAANVVVQDLAEDNPELRFGTPFETGMGLMAQSIDRFATDLSRGVDWCGRHEMFACPEAEERTRAMVLGRKADRILGYFALVRPFADCLRRDYVRAFPSGLPVQRTLHQAAAAFTGAIGAQTYNVVFDRDRWTTADALTLGLHQYTRYRKAYLGSEDGGGAARPQDSCQPFERFTPDVLRLAQVFTQPGDPMPAATREQWLAALDHLDRRDGLAAAQTALQADPPVLPYLAMFESAVITGAGFPEEAARHLERALTRYEDRVSNDLAESDAAWRRAGNSMTNPAAFELEGGRKWIERGSFPDFVSRTRLRAMLDSLYERTGLSGDRYASNKAYVERLADFLRRAHVFAEDRASMFVRWCARQTRDRKGLLRAVDPDSFAVDPDSYCHETAAAQTAAGGVCDRAFETKAEAETDAQAQLRAAEGWLRDYVEVFISQNLREFDAFMDTVDTPRGEADALIRRSRDLANLFHDSLDDAEVCVIGGRDVPEARALGLRVRLRFEVLATHGLLLGQVVDDRADPDGGAQPGDDAKRLLCEARLALRRAWRIARFEDPDDTVIGPSHPLYKRVEHQLRRLENRPLVCV